MSHDRVHLKFSNHPQNPLFGSGARNPQLCLRLLWITQTTRAKVPLTTLSPLTVIVFWGGGVVMGHLA